MNPEVLLLDEPTSSLDLTSTEKIEGLIRSLAHRLTVIMVTHDLPAGRPTGDRTALFFDGSLIEEGPTEQLFFAPKYAETVRYVSGLFSDRGPRCWREGIRRRGNRKVRPNENSFAFTGGYRSRR